MTTTTVGVLWEAVWGGCLLTAVLVTLLFFCAIQALLSSRLLVSAIYLAGTSILLSIIFFLLDAYQVAVIELSVGAGLVTVLLVFAINVAGEEFRENIPVVPKPLSWGLVLCSIILFGIFVLPIGSQPSEVIEEAFTSQLWKHRAVDVLVQVVLIFTGALGALGLLAEEKAPLKYPAAEEVLAKRDRELESILEESLSEEKT
jgi:NADH:ubiquinone oxidoreductase subunit 6 (subunit J)